MKDPLISIIVPVYNVEKYLHRCLDSIIHQTYKNLEIILIDDGSTDSSGNICDEYKKHDQRIIVVHQKNSGTAMSRNKGLDIFKGEYVSFVDADDYIAKDAIVTLYELLSADTSAGMAVGSSYKIFRNNEINNWVTLKDQIYYPQDIINNYVDAAWGKLYCRYIFNDIRFSPTFPNFEDAEIYVDIAVLSKKAICTSKPIYYYNSRVDSKLNILAGPNGSETRAPLNQERVDVLISISTKTFNYFKDSCHFIINKKFLDVFTYYVFRKKELPKSERKIFLSKLKNNYRLVKKTLFFKNKIKYRLKFVYSLYAKNKYNELYK